MQVGVQVDFSLCHRTAQSAVMLPTALLACLCSQAHTQQVLTVLTPVVIAGGLQPVPQHCTGSGHAALMLPAALGSAAHP